MTVKIKCPMCGQVRVGADPKQIIDFGEFGPTSRACLGILLAKFGDFVNTNTLITQMYSEKPPGKPANVVRTLALVARRRLKPHGLNVEGHQGSGYRLIWTTGGKNARGGDKPKRSSGRNTNGSVARSIRA